jgi:DNA-directed RNA polymerase III subunit RPC1
MLYVFLKSIFCSLKEIINAAKQISTPIITAKLERDDNKVAARLVKAMIEKTTLEEISNSIKEVYSPTKCYISIHLDMEAIEQLKLDIDAFAVRDAILNAVRGVTRSAVLRALKETDVLVKKGDISKLRVYVSHPMANKLSTTPYFAMQLLKSALPKVIVQGIPTVNRAVISEVDGSNPPRYNLLIEGYGLREVMGSPGINGYSTTTYVHFPFTCLGSHTVLTTM